jgi:hypothetical protein
MKIPKRILHYEGFRTARGYKSCKRKEMRGLERLLRNVFFGCAYWPKAARTHATAVRVHLRALREVLKVKNWGN